MFFPFPCPEPASLWQTALQAWNAGISCLPICADGSKRPTVRWKVYQQRPPTLAEIQRWFEGKQVGDVGLALLAGSVSGGLEICDFDTREIYEAWTIRMSAAGLARLLARLEHGYREETPQGVHLLYRCAQIPGNQKLARRPLAGSSQIQTLIETRGEGGYGIVAPSGGGVHPSGLPYRLLSGGIDTIPSLSIQERNQALAVARSLDRLPAASVAFVRAHPPSWTSAGRPFAENLRPGDRFNQQVHWEELLPRYGWERAYTRGKEGYWRRPGKRGPGISATTNYAGLDLLYVFSTATALEPGRGYTKFTAYTLLEHGGNFAAAARTLVAQGEWWT